MAQRLPLHLIILMIPLLACNYFYAVPDGSPAGTPTTTLPTVFVVTGEDFEAMVFNAEAQRLGDYTIFPNPTSYWTPSESDIQTLEAHIEAFLTNHTEGFYDHQPPVEAWLPAYARQYFGFERDGVQYIYGNFFCARDLLLDYPNQLVMVEDGGDCFFQFHYNPATQEFSNLMVNGYA
ncbi:MAG: hypothetical protein BroJett018_33980 [Chloroflexota bacterium]|nr:hypothetical protein [Chloroflexota bacterium]NOG64090.1 hypothetical protein [Chloroflexota bacterium]GIK65604.1 MAG: hypothetical protein BroJett018_33980 [Chloroflexota bacterium]